MQIFYRKFAHQRFIERREFNAALICSHLEGIRCYYTIDTDNLLIMSCNGYRQAEN